VIVVDAEPFVHGPGMLPWPTPSQNPWSLFWWDTSEPVTLLFTVNATVWFDVADGWELERVSERLETWMPGPAPLNVAIMAKALWDAKSEKSALAVCTPDSPVLALPSSLSVESPPTLLFTCTCCA
jgi:hypothetical protein